MRQRLLKVFPCFSASCFLHNWIMLFMVFFSCLCSPVPGVILLGDFHFLFNYHWNEFIYSIFHPAILFHHCSFHPSNQPILILFVFHSRTFAEHFNRLRRSSFTPSFGNSDGFKVVVEEAANASDEAAPVTNKSTPRDSLDVESPVNPYLLSPWRDPRETRKHSLPSQQVTEGITASQVRRLSERGGEGSGPSPREAGIGWVLLFFLFRCLLFDVIESQETRN